MSDSKTIPLQIRKIIFEKYNNSDVRFTNDEIFESLQQNGTVAKSLTIDDVEQHFTELCDSGVMRNIAQNFTTQWFKLFEPLKEFRCPSCQNQIYINKSDERSCPSCGAVI
jgi:rubrerythrin